MGTSVDAFVRPFVGSLGRAENKEINPGGCCRGRCRGGLVGAFVGPLVGSRFAFACSVRRPCDPFSEQRLFYGRQIPSFRVKTTVSTRSCNDARPTKLTVLEKQIFVPVPAGRHFSNFFRPDSGPPPVHMLLQRKQANSFVPAIFFPMAWPF